MGAALAGSLALAGKAAIDFESSFAGVRKTVDATEAEFSDLSDGLRKMATEIPVNVNELNRIAEAAGQLGIEKASILGFTETVAKLGVTTDLAGEQAASTLARLANITQMPQENMDRLGSTIVALGNKGAATESEIAEFGLRIAGAGKLAGLAESEILAIGESMSSVGVEAEAGGTAIQKVLLGITNAVATGNEDLEVFALAAGMSAERFAEAWRTDPAEAFVRFVEGLGAAGAGAFQILEKLGLQDQRLIRSFLSLAGAGDQLRRSVELGTNAWRENSALTEEAEKRFATTASKIQLAKNEVIEAAIAFGTFLLPVIGAVAGAVGELVSFLGDLPGPVQVALIAFMGLAGAVLLVAGSTLLLLPRLAAVKTLMAEAGIQGGIFRSSLSRLGGFLGNPFTLALTAATIGITLFAQEKANARARVAEFTAAVEADSGALGENTRAAVANRLEADELLHVYGEMGVSGAAVVDTLLEVAQALDRGDKATAEAALSTLHWSELTDEQRLALSGVVDELRKGVASAERTAEAQGVAAESTDRHKVALEGLQEEMSETQTVGELLADTLGLLAGSQIDAEKGALRWRDSIRDLRETIKDGKPVLEGFSEEADANREKILAAVDAALAHGAAVAEETGSVEKGGAAVRDHIRELISQAVQAGISEDAMRDYIAQLNLTPKEIRTAIRALVADAQLDIERFISRNEGRVITFVGRFRDVDDSTVGQLRHAGGVIGTSGARRLHAGGRLRGDEEWVIGQRGEEMFSKAKLASLRSILGMGPTTFRSPVHPTAGRGDIRVGIRLDRRRFTQELEHDVSYDGRWS
jgi:TP901 family phage tail tape measure protein